MPVFNFYTLKRVGGSWLHEVKGKTHMKSDFAFSDCESLLRGK